MDAAYKISEFLVNTKFDDLPSDVVEVVKKDILDTLGNALGGSSDSTIEAVHELVKEWGGKTESSIIAFGTKTTSFNAAFVNSTMAFALDLDDTHERGRLHAGVATVPTALAIAEMKGGVTGKEFITALCVAIEVACRLGIASERRTPGHIMGGWDYASLHGAFSSAAVAGKLLGLDEQQMHNALGIAYHQVAGNALSAIDEADSKKLGPGFAARSGIMSAIMAAHGITGAKQIFDESEIGLCHLYHAGCNRDALLAGLGTKFEMYDMGFKPYPSCRLGHRHIDAVLKLVKEHNIQSDEIEEITPSVCQFVHTQLCTPIAAKVKPANKTAAQFSLHWVLSAAAVRRRIGIRELNIEALKDHDLLDMAAQVKPILDSALPDENAFASVKIKTKKGTFETKTSPPYGSIENPMIFEDIESKFFDCSSFALYPIPLERLKNVVSIVRNLETIKDVKEIISLLS
jgi:2-methylcitrate dehydratase PrpD